MTSGPVSIKVEPRLRLGRVAAHRYSLRVFAAQSFAGKWATFQRFNGKRWIFVKRVQPAEERDQHPADRDLVGAVPLEQRHAAEGARDPAAGPGR